MDARRQDRQAALASRRSTPAPAPLAVFLDPGHRQRDGHVFVGREMQRLVRFLDPHSRILARRVRSEVHGQRLAGFHVLPGTRQNPIMAVLAFLVRWTGLQKFQIVEPLPSVRPIFDRGDVEDLEHLRQGVLPREQLELLMKRGHLLDRSIGPEALIDAVQMPWNVMVRQESAHTCPLSAVKSNLSVYLLITAAIAAIETRSKSATPRRTGRRDRPPSPELEYCRISSIQCAADFGAPGCPSGWARANAAIAMHRSTIRDTVGNGATAQS